MLKINYLENSLKGGVIKFLLIGDTVHWAICNEHSDIALLLGERFCLESLRGAGMVSASGSVLAWDSIGYDVFTPCELHKEISDLFADSKKEVLKVWIYNNS